MSKAVLAYAVMGFGIVLLVATLAWHGSAPQSSAIPTTTNYNATRICDEARDQDLDFSGLQDNHFEVHLTEGCFSGWVHIPKWWNDWHSQPTGDQTNYWSAFWYANDRAGIGPFPANDDHSLNKGIHDLFRLQGHGTILFYTNQPAQHPQAQEASSPTSRLPSVENPISEIAEGPGISKPIALHRVEPVYTEEAKRARFSGEIVVDLIVGKDGRTHNITIENSPGYGLDENIMAAVAQWTFRPAEKDGNPVAVKAKITITMQLR